MSAAPEKAPRGIVKSLDRALEVLTCFSAERVEWGVAEVARYLGLSSSSAHRFLNTFEYAGYLERTETHRYRLSVRFVELANIYRFQQRFLWVASQPMQILAHETGALVHLGQLHSREVLELVRASPTPAVGCIPSLRMPAHSTSLGKVLLAFSGQETVDRFIGTRKSFKRLTPFTIAGCAEFREHLREVAKRGYAMDDQECQVGQRCIGVPVYDPEGKLIAGLSASGTIARFTDAEAPRIVARLRATAAMITAGFRQP